MNENLQKAFAEFLNYLIQNLKAGVELGKEQIPLVLTEVLQYELVMSLIWIGISITGGIASLRWFLRSRKLQWVEPNPRYSNMPDAAPWNITQFFVSLSLMVSSVLVLVGNADIALKIWLAPRVYLLEYLRGLLR